MHKHSKEDIITILHSISKLSIQDGQLDVFFDSSKEPMGVVEFQPDSFTRQLLELIERHLLDE